MRPPAGTRYTGARRGTVARGRAAQLVVAQMLSEIASDVRMQLGATYGASVELAERRLGTFYILGSSIDVSRIVTAIKLLNDRIARLRSDHDLAARIFVAARNRVLARLTSTGGSAVRIANRIMDDVAFGRAVMSDIVTAAAVRDLTLGAIFVFFDF